MLHVDTKAPEERWLDPKGDKYYGKQLEGVRLKVRAQSPAMTMAASDAALLVYKKAGFDPTKEDAEIPDRVRYDAQVAYGVAMAIFAITAWEGIGDQNDNEIPATEENVRAAFRDPELYGFFNKAYDRGSAKANAEKNASAPSQPGTGGARTPAKGTAATAPHRARTARTP